MESDEEGDLHCQTERKLQLGLRSDDQFDDQRSELGDRKRKKKWNDLLDQRKQRGSRMFNNKQTIELARID